MAKRKKPFYERGVYWGIQMTLFGLVLGVPFFVSGKSYLAFIAELTWPTAAMVFIATVLLGIFVEGYLKKVKII
jgi:hypothetical protein